MSENLRQLPAEFGDMVEKIVASFSPERIILFGSYAYGKITADSDVDLLVIMDTDLPSAERQRQISRVLRPRRFPLDIIVKNPTEIQKSKRRVDPFMNEILDKGIVLYARR